ncbi:MAG: phosphatidylserine decarboxylase [Oscillospiraceae bacterium]|nr:phosphatidylserine decarboxylase [Oscillospiraceae bacterium]
MNSRKRDGTLVEVYDGEGKIIDFLYGSGFGRGLLKVLVAPWVSNLAGWFLDSGLSRFLVKPFVKKNHLDLSEYPDRAYGSFNDFFTRTILPGKRTIAPGEDRLIAPSDGKVTAFPLEENAQFRIKGSDYTLSSLLRSEKQAERYRGGWGLLFRLSVDDYHRYCYPVSGEKGENVRIPGVYHTVNPRAAEARPIYQENTREYTQIRSEQFGNLLMMEVGAMLVGRIKNLHGPGKVNRGEEKGYFEFGGSSIVLLLEPERFQPDADIVENSARGEETVVKLGESVGTKYLKNNE